MVVTDLGTVQESRRAVQAIVLPDAPALPKGLLATLPPTDGVRRALAVADLDTACARNQLLRELQAALGCLPSVDAWVGARHALDVASAAEPHDAYFRVARSREAAPLAYVRALLQGLLVWAGEIEHEGLDADAAPIGAALADLWNAAFGHEQALPAWGASSQAAGTRHRDARAAVRRWLHGHQVFAVLTQGLVWTLNRFAAAADDAAARTALARVVRLYDASAAAFRFTADFDAQHYTELIRPSMSEPHAPAGFSGSLSPDHGCLVGLLTALRTPLAQAAQRFPAESAAMKQSLTRLYDDHKRVCTRLAGLEGPSLRSARAADQPAAAEMLDRFLARRIALLN